MLNKQGLFSRGAESPNPAIVNRSANNGAVHPAPPQSTHPAATAPVTTVTGITATNEAAPTPESEAKQESGSRLIVGPNVKLKGAEIQDCDTLVVEGRVEATMDSRVIQIAEDGAFSGKVGIDVAEVFGKFEGELTARSQLIIHSSGKVSGKIRYGKIFIEEGGELSGDIASISSESGKANTRTSALHS